MAMRADVIVLGAGMAGVSVALHLLLRSRDVVLVDHRRADEETSYGNAGLIQREGVIPWTQAIAPPSTRSLGTSRLSTQCLVQIRDQVVGILDPDRNANKCRRDTQP